MRKYRNKHLVEAMRWAEDSDDAREAFATWFEMHDMIFETRGSVVCLPECTGLVPLGNWIVFDRKALTFFGMGHDEFKDTYEAA